MILAALGGEDQGQGSAAPTDDKRQSRLAAETGIPASIDLCIVFSLLLHQSLRAELMTLHGAQAFEGHPTRICGPLDAPSAAVARPRLTHTVVCRGGGLIPELRPQ